MKMKCFGMSDLQFGALRLTRGCVNMALLNVLFVLYNWDCFNPLKPSGFYMYCQV